MALYIFLSLWQLSLVAGTGSTTGLPTLPSAVDNYKSILIDGGAKASVHPTCDCLYIETANLFRNNCYKQLSEICKADVIVKGHHNSEEACAEANKPLEQGVATALKGGTIGLAYEICKTPMEFTVKELETYMALMPPGMFPPTLAKSFSGQNIQGRDLPFITIDEMIGMGMKVGDAKTFGHLQKSFLDRKLPYDIRPRASLKADSEVDVTVYIESVWGVDELAFSFNCAFSLMFSWTDRQMWQSCLAVDDDVDKGICGATWRPEVRFPNARGSIPEPYYRYLLTDPVKRHGLYYVSYFGEFQAPMGFKEFPWDIQELSLQFQTKDFVNPQRLLFNPVRTVERTAESSPGKDVVSGWKVSKTSAKSITTDPVPVPPHIKEAELPAMMARGEPLAFSVEKKILFMGQSEGHLTTVLATIEVWRAGEFYFMNYVICAYVLTALSFVVYLMDETEVSNRTGLALTIIVALNVFQIILNVEIPKTAYLTPMHSYYLVSVLLCTFAGFQSMLMYKVQLSFNAKVAAILKKECIAEDKKNETEAEGLPGPRAKSPKNTLRLRVKSGPDSAMVHPADFVSSDLKDNSAAESKSEPKDDYDDDEPKVDFNKHGFTLKAQNWVLTYLDQIFFATNFVGYTLFTIFSVCIKGL